MEFEITYKYKNNTFKFKIEAKNKEEAKSRFLYKTHGDWCKIEKIEEV